MKDTRTKLRHRQILRQKQVDSVAGLVSLRHRQGQEQTKRSACLPVTVRRSGPEEGWRWSVSEAGIGAVYIG